jgi:hypothetical protein
MWSLNPEKPDQKAARQQRWRQLPYRSEQHFFGQCRRVARHSIVQPKKHPDLVRAEMQLAQIPPCGLADAIARRPLGSEGMPTRRPYSIMLTAETGLRISHAAGI